MGYFATGPTSLQKYLKAEKFEDIRHIVNHPKDFISRSARPYEKATRVLHQELLLPHLREKASMVSGNFDEDACLILDQKMLKQAEKFVVSEPAFNLNKAFLLEVIRGMLAHSHHRPDILKLNDGKVVPENGPLIREMYELTERTAEVDISRLLKSLSKTDALTDSFLKCDTRQLIRSIVRVGATQHNLKLSARQSLVSSVLAFPERYESVLVELNIKNLVDQVVISGNKQPSEEGRLLKKKFGTLFSSSLSDKGSLVHRWIEDQFSGLTFADLVEKYMNQQKSFEDALRIVATKSTKPNQTVSQQMANERATRVTEAYKNDRMQFDLYKPAFLSPEFLRYELVEMIKGLLRNSPNEQ